MTKSSDRDFGLNADMEYDDDTKGKDETKDNSNPPASDPIKEVKPKEHGRLYFLGEMLNKLAKHVSDLDDILNDDKLFLINDGTPGWHDVRDSESFLRELSRSAFALDRDLSKKIELAANSIGMMVEKMEKSYGLATPMQSILRDIGTQDDQEGTTLADREDAIANLAKLLEKTGHLCQRIKNRGEEDKPEALKLMDELTIALFPISQRWSEKVREIARVLADRDGFPITTKELAEEILELIE